MCRVGYVPSLLCAELSHNRARAYICNLANYNAVIWRVSMTSRFLFSFFYVFFVLRSTFMDFFHTIYLAFGGPEIHEPTESYIAWNEQNYLVCNQHQSLNISLGSRFCTLVWPWQLYKKQTNKQKKKQKKNKKTNKQTKKKKKKKKSALWENQSINNYQDLFTERTFTYAPSFNKSLVAGGFEPEKAIGHSVS